MKLNNDLYDEYFLYQGKTVDIVRSDVDFLWSVYYDNKRIVYKQPTKKLAYNLFIKYVNSQIS